MKKKTLTPEQIEKQKELLLEREIKDIEEKISFGILPLNPTRKFEINERVTFGAHHEVYIRQIYKDGLYYKVESLNVQRVRDEPSQNEFRIKEWIDIFPFKKGETSFAKEETHIIQQSNSSLDSLLHKVYHPGVDFDVEYQREHVWTLDDKVALIDSIFNNIEIGKFIFVQRDYGFHGKLYEIIDGKQRLTALTEFYEDRFKYKGYYFSELSNKDKNKFENHSVSWGYLVNPSRKAILETFIKFNTCGKPMSKIHIDNVRNLLNEIK